MAAGRGVVVGCLAHVLLCGCLRGWVFGGYDGEGGRWMSSLNGWTSVA